MAQPKRKGSPQKDTRSPKKDKPDELTDEEIIPELHQGKVRYQTRSGDHYLMMKYKSKLAVFGNYQSLVYTIACTMTGQFISIITFMNPKSNDGDVIIRLYQIRNGKMELRARKCYSGLDNFNDNQAVVDEVTSVFKKYRDKMQCTSDNDEADLSFFRKISNWVVATFGEDDVNEDGDPSHNYDDDQIGDRSGITLQQHMGTDGDGNGKGATKERKQSEKKQPKPKIHWKSKFEALTKLIESLSLADEQKNALLKLADSLEEFRANDLSNQPVSMGPKATLSFPELVAAVGLLESIIPCAQELSHLLNKVLNSVMNQLKKMLDADPAKLKDWDVKQLTSILAGRMNADNTDQIIKYIKHIIGKMTSNQKMALLIEQ